MLLKVIQEGVKLVRRHGYPIARGLAEYEKPLFKWAYNTPRLSRYGRPIYRGYKAGTVAGLTGDAILDALTSTDSTETGKNGKTRNNMVKPRRKRQYRQKCRTNGRRGWTTRYR